MKKFWSGEETRRNGDELFRVKVVGSNPAGPTTGRTGPARARIFATLWELRKRGFSDITLKVKGERLRHLAKHVDLDDPEAVKGYIAMRARACTLHRIVSYEINHYLCAFGTFVFLHKMPGILNYLVGLSFSSRDYFLKQSVSASRNRITI